MSNMPNSNRIKKLLSLMAILIISAAFVFISNLIADIAYGLLDPRVRYD